MLRSNVRLIFGGLAAAAFGLAGGWALLAVSFDESSAPTMQTSAVIRAIATDSRASSPPAASTPSPDSEPTTPPTKVEPVSPTPTPVRVVETAPQTPSAGATVPARLPATAPTTGKHTKAPIRVSAKWRARLRDDDDDDDC